MAALYISITIPAQDDFSVVRNGISGVVFDGPPSSRTYLIRMYQLCLSTQPLATPLAQLLL